MSRFREADSAPSAVLIEHQLPVRWAGFSLSGCDRRLPISDQILVALGTRLAKSIKGDGYGDWGRSG